MNQTEYALLNVEDDTMRLWNMANEDTNDVNTNEMIDFLERKGKYPPLPLKKSNFFRNFYAPTRYDPDQKYNMEQYNPFYVQRAKIAWKKYKEDDDQIRRSAVESERYQQNKIKEEEYSKIKNAVLQNIRNFDPMKPLYLEQKEDLERSLDSLKPSDKTDLKTELSNVVFNKTTPKPKPWLYMFSPFKPRGGKSKRVTRVKRSRRVKRSTKRRKH